MNCLLCGYSAEVPIQCHPARKELGLYAHPSFDGVKTFLTGDCTYHREGEIYRLKESRDKLEAELEKARVKLANPYQFPPPAVAEYVVKNCKIDGVMHFACSCGCGQYLTAPRMASHFCAKIP